MKPIVTWIAVADGGRMRVFENRGPGKGLVPVKGLNLEDEHLRDQDIEADRPGRSHSPAGPRSSIEPQTDPVEYREAAFARRVAEMLEGKLAEGAFNRLIIAADPSALGNLRGALTPAVSAALVGELAKDLTKVQLADMAAHFEALLAV